MQYKYVIVLTVITIVMVLLCRLRNCDRQFRKIEVKGRVINMLLFPVTIYGKTTIGSMIICTSYEILIALALFLIFMANIKISTICYFWGTFQIFSGSIAGACENFVEWKKQEDIRKKNTCLTLGIFFVIAAIIFLTLQIFDFIEVS